MKTEDLQKPVRVKFRQLAQVAQEDSETGLRSEVMGSTVDIGVEGMRFEADCGFQLEAEVTVCLSVGERIIEARGRVVSFAPSENEAVCTDIEFIELSDSDRVFIEDLCRARAGRE